MPATPTTRRQPPPRRFENYILTRSTATSIGLTNVADNLFSPCSPGLSGSSGQFSDPGQPWTFNGLSTPLDIGFDFQFDGITYKQFVADGNGWMALVDPSLGTFSPREVFTNGDTTDNSDISGSFASNAVLLAPWFDSLHNTASDPAQLSMTHSLAKIDRIRKGLETPNPAINAVQNSVKFYRDRRSSRGRRLIVRWNVLFDFINLTTVLRYEAVIYENGTIEFRYTPRQSISIPSQANLSSERATIGIFMPNGTNRWRDFSYGLGYRDPERQQYRYGGAVVNGTYSDTRVSTVKFTVRLQSSLHWPGLDFAGSMYTFLPPPLRRRVLPRQETSNDASRLTLPTVARTGDPRRGNDQINFDDRRSVLYTNVLSGTGGLVNYPSTLQRFYGDSEPNVVKRQNLFAGDFEFTASVVRNAIDQFITDDLPKSIEPFSDYKLFENDQRSNPFFSSGSNLNALGDSLQQPLLSKTQIRLSLPINNTTVLFGTASTIHYYNRRAAVWNVPQNSSYTITPAGTTNNSGVPRGDLVPNLVPDSIALRVLEDQRGFGPVGNCLSSGSHNRSGNGDQTDAFIGAPWSTLNVTNALNRLYPKSVSVNEDYRANSDEVITLPINQPFLIERAVIELPFAAGDGWFQDKTTCLTTLENTPVGGFDFAGPALTVALFNQSVLGNLSRRDLIMTGTLTHANDFTSEIVCSAFPPISSTFQIRPRGFLAFAGQPGAIVTPTSASGTGLTFTGSVPVLCEAQVSNGVILRVELAMTSSDIQANKSGVIDVFNSAQLTLGNQVTNHYSQSCYIAYINNFGRGGTGFDPSGRSVFGKEFATSQVATAQGRVSNPFYLTGTNGGAVSPTFMGVPTQFSQSIAQGSTFKFEAALPLESYQPSPYLVMPGDTLVLAVSKTRPVFLSSQAASPFTSGAIQHDVQLLTGAINIVLYGSLLSEGQEFHDTINQPLASDAVHEIVVGNEAVLDQFRVDYRDSFVNGSYDDFIAGSLITKITRPDGRIAFVTGTVVGGNNSTNVLSTGSRGRIFSKNNARSAPTPGTSANDYSTSQSFQLQPYYEKAGTVRLAQAIDNSERFWDSLMPGINECFTADGAVIWMIKPGGFPIIGPPSPPVTIDPNVGFIFFDYQISQLLPGVTTVQDSIWTKSYPFEPRYAGISRQQFIQRSFVASHQVDVQLGSLVIYAIEPRQLSGFFFGPGGTSKPSVPPIVPPVNTQLGGNAITMMSDFVTTINNFTTSAGLNDALKGLYGFGDLNTLTSSSFSPLDTTMGTNHFADFRKKTFESNGSIWFSTSPIIRGWKYGVYSGLPAFSKAYFRQDRYGQFRDMLEQRSVTKYFQTAENNPGIDGFKEGTTPAVVNVKFVDSTGKLTQPENTWSQNLSFEATSSMPYFDGETRNRPDINTATLNANIIAFNANQFGQVTL